MDCRICHRNDFNSWTDLAKHILSSPGHQRSHKFASKVLLNPLLKTDRELPTRSTMTEEERDTFRAIKEDFQVTLSGDTEKVIAICSFCKSTHYATLPIEYLELPYLWRSQKGTLVRTCNSCESSDRRKR